MKAELMTMDLKPSIPAVCTRPWITQLHKRACSSDHVQQSEQVGISNGMHTLCTAVL